MNETDQTPTYPYMYRSSWPNTEYPDGTDPPFIAPFYAESELRIGASDSSEISYRILDLSDQSKPANERVGDVISCAVKFM